MTLDMENPLIYLFKKTWHYAGNRRRSIVLYMAMCTLASIAWALDPLVIGSLLNAIQKEGVHIATLPKLFLLLGIFLLLEIIFWALHGPARVIENKIAFVVRNNYKNYLLDGTLALPIDWHADHHSGDTISKIEKGTDALFNFSGNIFQVLQGFILLVTAFGALFFYDVYAGIIAVVISIFTFYLLVIFDKKLVPGYKAVNRMENTTSAKVFDVLSNVTTVIILRVEPLVLKTINLFMRKPLKQYTMNAKTTELKWFCASVCGRFIMVGVLAWYLLSHAASGVVLVGTIYILYGYTNQIREIFYRFAYIYNDIVRYRASVSNAEELSISFQDIAGQRRSRLPEKWSTLSIHDLSFSYHTKEGADLHLNNVGLNMKKGERIALIGESGGGKTTFLKILRDLYHPKSLTLTIDGKNISGGFTAISDSISLIPQDPEIFATTIRENITLGVEYPEERLNVFTRMASFVDVVKRLPNKMESSIVEKGVNLSGGEKQRLALARGLLASVDKDIILLDEPTSSVDFHNELEIFKNIFTAFEKKTIISSVHRLHLLSLFDTVYFFKGGKIIASGSFEDLQKSSTDFQELWQKYIQTRDNITS